MSQHSGGTSEKTFCWSGRVKRERGTGVFPAVMLKGEMRGRVRKIYSFIINFTGRITALHCKCGYSRGGARTTWLRQGQFWPPLLLLFWRSYTQGGLLCRSYPESLKGRCWDFLSAIQLLSVIMLRASEVTASCSRKSTHYILTPAAHEALNYKQKVQNLSV